MASSSPPPEIRWALPEDRPEALRCYERNGYAGGIRPGDRVLVADRGERIVGVVRLVDEDGHRVVRGLFLDEGERRRGLGRRMIERLVDALEGRDCWLICSAHLVPFYGRTGFGTVPEPDAPAHLRARAVQYARAHGPQVVMRRSAASAPRSGVAIDQ
jgi:GNAT superfamily N-acetyltransferase